MFNRRAGKVLGLCASLTVGSAAVAASVPPPLTTQPVAAAAKISDIGCTVRLLWFINASHEMVKDPSQPENYRIEMYHTTELMRGALGFFEARLDALPPSDHSAESSSELAAASKMPSELRVAEVTICLNTYRAAETRVKASMEPKK